MKKITLLLSAAALYIAAANAQGRILLEDFENFPVENFWTPDLEDRTGTFFYYDANRAPLLIVDNPQPAGVNTSAKVCRVQVFAGAANSGILKIEFTGGGKPGQPVIEYPACPECTGEKYDRLRFKYYKGSLTGRYAEFEPNGTATNPKTIVATADRDEWQTISFELANASYNNFQIRVNRNETGSGSAPGTADGDFIYVDDFELFDSATESMENISSGKTIERTEYFDTLGRRVAQPQRGLVIKRITYADGATRTVKEIIN